MVSSPATYTLSSKSGVTWDNGQRNNIIAR